MSQGYAPANQPSPDRELAPRRLRIATGLLMLTTLAIVTIARLTDAPLAATPAMDAPIAAEREIILHGEMSGAAIVMDTNGAVFARLSAQDGGFISGVWRALTQVRKQHRVPAGLPIRLIRFESGRLALVDDHTGWRAELIGFGPDNTRAFARLLQ